MNEYQILDEAIALVKKRGWKAPEWLSDVEDTLDVETFHEHKLYYVIIFDHSFCRALWPDEENSVDEGGGTSWLFHMGIMVARENPLEYLGEYLNENILSDNTSL